MPRRPRSKAEREAASKDMADRREAEAAIGVRRIEFRVTSENYAGAIQLIAEWGRTYGPTPKEVYRGKSSRPEEKIVSPPVGVITTPAAVQALPPEAPTTEKSAAVGDQAKPQQDTFNFAS